VADLTGRNAAIQRALVNFGSAPDLAALAKSLGMTEADLQNAVGPDIQQLAKENTSAGLSTEARLRQANQDAIAQIKAALNKRGLLNSGEAGYELDRQNTGFRQAEYDANQKLLDYLNQYQQGYVSAQDAKNAQLAQAYSDAANRQYANTSGSAGFDAPYAFTDANGTVVYKSADGRLWNMNRTPYVPPQPAPSAPPTSFGNPNVGYQQTPRVARAFGAA
jgi:hypothetical protein